MEIVAENDLRYMRYEPNPYRGDRYAIYERGDPDVLVFWTHGKEAAMLHWDAVKNAPVRRRRSPFIFW